MLGASSLLAVVALVTASCTSAGRSDNAGHASVTISAANAIDTLTSAPAESSQVSTSAHPVPTSAPDVCTSFVPAGYEFFWSEQLTVAEVQETVRTLVTLAPDGVTTTLALQGADPDAAASLCWGVKPADAESWVQYYVGPSGATGVMCLASGSRLLVVNGSVNDACF